jgi:hypothetical protein
MRALWTHGPGTDIKASSPACAKFEAGGRGSEKKVIVCNSCFQASCFQGFFMCEKAREAGITIKTVAELKELGREHPDYWK